MHQPHDDEDLDDLDDVLDQFTLAPPKAPPNVTPPPNFQVAAPITLTSSSKSPAPAPDGDGFTAEDFARELTKGMESLMREMGNGGLMDEGEDEMDMRDVFGKGGGLNEESQGRDDFQTTIKQAMEKLKETESTLKGDSDPSHPEGDPFEGLLAQLRAAGDGESEEQLDGLLETMMSQLMSKEVLYEPLKELHDKFPSYLKDHPDLAADGKKRYESQYQSISKIFALFDDPAYKDGDPRIVGLMTEMQSFGSPPPEIMGPMLPGFGFEPDGTPQIPDGCIVV